MPDKWIPGQVARSNLVHYIERSQVDPSLPRVCSIHNPTGPGAHVLTACGLHRSPIPHTHDYDVDCMPCVMEASVGPEQEIEEEVEMEEREPEPAEADT